jgi:acetolactate synthase I/II/III large subunit
VATAATRLPATASRAVTGGHLVARALKAEGIDTTFILCGEYIIDIYGGCTDVDIRNGTMNQTMYK